MMHINTTARRSARLTAGLLAVAAVIAPGANAGTGKTFKTVLAPQSVPAGATSTITATIANLSDPQGLGAANLTAPAGWTVSAVTTTRGTATVAGQVVQLRNLALSPGQGATVSMVTKVPCGTGTGTYAVQAKQANDFNGTGNDLTLDTSVSDLTVDRSGGCSLRFVTQPPAEVGSGTPFTTSVEVLSGNGARSTSSNTVSLAAVTGTLGGPASVTTSNGLATFNGVSITAPDRTITNLTASSPGYSPATSDPVTVHGSYVTCDPTVQCTAAETYNYTYDGAPRKASVTLTALAGDTASTLVVDQSLVPNPTTADPGCSGDDLPQPVIARFLGVNRALKLVQTVDKSFLRPFSVNDLFYGGPLRPCLTLPYPFSGGVSVDPVDGKPAYRGVVGRCDLLGVIPYTTEPCILSQETTADGDYSMTLALKASALDPYTR